MILPYVFIDSAGQFPIRATKQYVAAKPGEIVLHIDQHGFPKTLGKAVSGPVFYETSMPEDEKRELLEQVEETHKRDRHDGRFYFSIYNATGFKPEPGRPSRPEPRFKVADVMFRHPQPHFGYALGKTERPTLYDRIKPKLDACLNEYEATGEIQPDIVL